VNGAVSKILCGQRSDSAVATVEPGVFSPGVPAVFLANYEAAVAFLEGLERRCTLRADVEAFRASAAVDGFLKRWKLSVYFSLRFQVSVGRFRDGSQLE